MTVSPYSELFKMYGVNLKIELEVTPKGAIRCVISKGGKKKAVILLEEGMSAKEAQSLGMLLSLLSDRIRPGKKPFNWQYKSAKGLEE